MIRALHPVAWLLAMLIVGCASLGVTPAQSFSDRLAYAVGTNTALRNSATNALNAQSIDSEDAAYVLGVTDQSRAFLDAAKFASEAGDPSTAEGRLGLALNVLEQLESYLNQRVTP